MYKHIQLNAHGALASRTLENLGRMVVVCGKNNSGKSTLLLAIQDGHQYLKPVELETQKYEALVHLPDGSRWRHASDIIGPVPQYKDMWTEKDADEFVRLVQQEYSRWRIVGTRPVSFHSEMLGQYKTQLWPHKLVLIPPKRLLELTDTIQTSRAVAPDGQGLLNFLFRAVNQFENSAERKLYEEIRRIFNSVSDGYDFTITAGANNDLQLFFGKTGGAWIPADASGLGLQDLLVLLFFAINPDYDILLVEEPESHLHPAMQRKLLHYCKEKTDKQFFFSTHSSVFLDLTFVDTILHTEMIGQGIEVSNDTSRAAVLDSLGYSVTDNLVSDLIILVEGPSDKPVLEEFLRKMGLYTSYTIKVWPLGGDIMSQCDLSVFAEKYQIIALIDKDLGSKVIRTRFKHNCALLDIEVYQLKRRAIENYFTVDALKNVFKGQIPESLVDLNCEETLESQIGINVKNNNHKIAKAMTLEDIQDTDLYSFLQKVAKKLKG